MLRALERQAAQRILAVERAPADAEVRGAEAAVRRARSPSRGASPARRGTWYQRASRCPSSVAHCSTLQSWPSCSSAGLAPVWQALQAPAHAGGELARIAEAHRRRRIGAARPATSVAPAGLSRSTTITGPSVSRCCAYGKTLRAHIAEPAVGELDLLARSSRRDRRDRATARAVGRVAGNADGVAASGRRTRPSPRIRAFRPAGSTRGAPATARPAARAARGRRRRTSCLPT